MVSKDDWRLQGQENYLTGVRLYKKKYQQYGEEWDHDHCEFCSRKFSLVPTKGELSQGYSTEDNYRWICEKCFNDFQELFKWQVTEII